MDISRARKCYYQLGLLLDSTAVSNPLMSKHQIEERTDYVVEACIISIMKWLEIEDNDINHVRILDSIRLNLPFDSVLQ